MKLDEETEEILESLWVWTVEGGEPGHASALQEDKKLLKSFVKEEYITVSGEEIALTEKGRELAAKVIRRHRLAERLMTDVLEMRIGEIEEPACMFEHAISEDSETAICTLLGHPRECPHGNPIPKGDCCEEGVKSVGGLIKPMSEMSSGEEGKIAYILTRKNRNLRKLMGMGVLPGVPVSIIRAFPSYVFQIGETQIAIDKEMASDIYVRPGLGGLRRRQRFKRRWRGGIINSDYYK